MLPHMLASLEITPVQALSVIVSTIGMYAAFLVMVRLFGSRVLARMTTFDLVVTLMMGAIAGRVVVGEKPVLAAGILGLATLLLLEVGVGTIRRYDRGNRLLNPAPMLIIADGQIVPEGMRRAHLTAPEVYGALRQQGVRHVEEVAYGIFEPTGLVSVLRTGTDVDHRLLTDVIDPRTSTARPIADIG